MRKKNDDKFENNIVYFPHLKERLTDKGMHALQEKDFHEAIVFFEQLVAVEPDHPQGNIGMVLCLIEMKRLEEAKERCETLLKRDIGDYFDTVQIYISILIQLGEYVKSKELIEALFQEEKVPAHLIEHFEQILQFSEKMVINIDKEAKIPNQHELNQIRTRLEKGNREEQLSAIQEINRIDDHSLLPYIKKYLMDPSADPINKTIMLTILKEKGVVKKLNIHKFGKVLEVDVSTLIDPFDLSFNISVLNLVAEQLEQENPTLFEMNKQLWWNYILSIYPSLPEPANELIWANGLLMAGFQFNGIEVENDTLIVGNDLDMESVQKCTDKIIQNERLLSSHEL